MNKEEWVLTEERVTEFEFRETKYFNMLINNQMFDELEHIAEAKKVKELIREIVARTIPALSKVGTDNNQWKMFQHLLPQQENTDKNECKKLEKDENLMKNGKKRKHQHHFVQIEIARSDYNQILQLHNRVNTFSMALIIRMMVLVFLSIYHKKGQNKEKAIKALVVAIEKLAKKKVTAQINFILLKETLVGSNKWRAVAFFQVEYFEKEKKEASFFFRIRL